LKRKFAILTLFAGITCIQAQSAKYVSTFGVDAPASGTLANPYRTITYAATTLVAGDTLFVRGGTYTNTTYNDGYYWNQDRTARVSGMNGSPTQYIVIMPYNNEQPVLKGDGDFIFQITGCSYIKVQGFEVYGETENMTLPLALQYQFAFRRTTNIGANNVHENRVPVGTTTDQSGLEDLTAYTIFRPYYFFTHGLVVQNSHHIDIIGNTVHHMPGEGIRFAGSDYINCNKNIVHNNARRSSTGVHGISCYSLASVDNSTATKVIFDGNMVYNNYNELMSWSESKTIFSATIDEGKGLTIQRSFAAGGQWDFGRVLFVNNIAYGNGLSGLHVNDGDRIDIINNTVYHNDRYGYGNNLGISVAGGNDIKIYNNIVEANLAWGGFTISKTPTTTNVVVSRNLVNGGLDADVDAIDAGTIFGTATFVNAASSNFKLQSTSLGINNALAFAAPAKDYYNVLRDGFPDIGAAEFISALPLSLLAFTATKQNNHVLLQWKTTNEINTAYFIVQHAADGVQWNSIETVAASSFSSAIKNYTANHLSPVTGKNYYRLLQKDSGGRIVYSSVVNINFPENELIQIYPNPFATEVFIMAALKDKSINLYDITGADVSNQVNIIYTPIQTKIETTLLKDGIYTLRINNQSYLILKTK
jgi:parallel beta-helix repeat protein